MVDKEGRYSSGHVVYTQNGPIRKNDIPRAVRSHNLSVVEGVCIALLAIAAGFAIWFLLVVTLAIGG